MPKGEWVELNPPERERRYIYAGVSSELVYKNVRRIKVSESGNHYIEADGVNGHAIVAPGWRAIELDVDSWTF